MILNKHCRSLIVPGEENRHSMLVDDVTRDEVIRAQDRGLNAFFEGVSVNPYPPGSLLAVEWLQSYWFAAEL